MEKEIITIIKTIMPIFTMILGIIIKKIEIIIRSSRYKLLEHRIFNELILNKNIVENWEIKKNREVFRKALLLMVDIWYDELYKIAKFFDNSKYISRIKIRNMFINALENVYNRSNEILKLNNIPNLVINRIFNTHEKTINKVKNEIELISIDKTIPSIKLIERILFDNLRLIILEMKDDWFNILLIEKYNGSFKGIEYEGIPVNDDEFEKYNKGGKNE